GHRRLLVRPALPVRVDHVALDPRGAAGARHRRAVARDVAGVPEQGQGHPAGVPRDARGQGEARTRRDPRRAGARQRDPRGVVHRDRDPPSQQRRGAGPRDGGRLAGRRRPAGGPHRGVGRRVARRSGGEEPPRRHGRGGRRRGDPHHPHQRVGVLRAGAVEDPAGRRGGRALGRCGRRRQVPLLLRAEAQPDGRARLQL
ncbi:MAG: Protein disulfide oxidoreductase, partial [uncultured Nocardioides sp.]